MHIPDGFIGDPRIWGGCYVLSMSIMGYAARRSRETLSERSALLPGMTGAFLFAAQMFNFPVAGGTSGHLLGGVLACALLGGWTGILVTAMVLVIQCLLFQDGGITALGANILNMAVIGGGGGYLFYRLMAPLSGSRRVRQAVLGVGAAFGVLLSATCVALEIGLSGVVPVSTALVSMLAVHVPIALVEGLATTAIVGALERMRPDLIQGFDQPVHGARVWVVGSALVAALALLAVGFASTAPDGLEYVARMLGFESRAAAAIPAMFPGYAASDDGGFVSRAGIALFGVGAVALGAGILAHLLHRFGKREER